ncbi:uncharacterized protein LOC133730771 [Rosa rugosa]|uniref:uncharacterized protein LOC133730771 n=1 Tax=Rosa rugosa TaxID=74645 RepID=UPI002B412D62|nr:uncharacterized protein LOC133730771 [Rosa rugosa]
MATPIDSFDPQNQQNRPKLHRNSSLFALPQATAEQIDSFDPQNQQNRPKRPQLFALRHPPSHRSSSLSPKPPQNRSIHSIPKTSKTDPSHCSSSPSPKPPQLHRSSSLFVLPQATAALRPSPSPKPPQLHRSSSLSALPQATAAPPRLCLRLPLLRASASKRVDELRKLLSDKDAYHQFFLSLDQVKVQNNLREELRKETLQLTRENLEKEPRMVELRNQVGFITFWFLLLVAISVLKITCV